MECSICLEQNDNLVKCISIIHNHGFCNNCFQDWIHSCNQNHSDVTCPICHILIQKYEVNNNNDSELISDEIEEDYISEENEESYYYTYENSIFTEYYDAEKSIKAFEVIKINDRFEGIAITYWSNGNIMRISNYVNDKKYGTQKEYNSNGTLYGIEYIYNDNYHGSRKIFNKDGSTNRIEHYIQGNLINNDYLSEIS
jgi:antitoxin component YwqK of YwqJK toxin-antitoxin module